MSLPPLDPEKSASGIILDPKTLERVVPTSKRSDGTVRKELKIRPGFTPQEDIGRFRSTRQSAADSRKGFVPGSNRAPPPKAPDPDNPFAQEKKEKTKAQLKNEKRREKKRTEAADKDWDEDEDDVEPSKSGSLGVDGPAKATDAEVTGQDGPIPSELAFPPLGSHGTPPPIPVQDDPQASNIPASQPADSSSTQNGVDMPDPPPPASDPPASATDLSPSTQSTALPSSASQSSKPDQKNQKRHPIQGGRDGPIGLAHPPPIEQTKSEKSANWRKEPAQKSSATGGKAKGVGKPGGTAAPVPKANGQGEAQKPTSEPRVRKEVKIRQGHNDVGGLASRVRSMVLENQNSTPRAKKEATPNP